MAAAVQPVLPKKPLNLNACTSTFIGAKRPPKEKSRRFLNIKKLMNASFLINKRVGA